MYGSIGSEPSLLLRAELNVWLQIYDKLGSEPSNTFSSAGSYTTGSAWSYTTGSAHFKAIFQLLSY